MSEHMSTDGSAPVVVKVLIVDDEERFRESLAKRLTLRGFLVEHTDSGEEAIRMARTTRPDVVLLDRKMPKMAGEEVLRELKKIVPEVQVIMLTGHATVESAAASGRLDAYAYLTKPCETDELITTIESAAREKRRAMARHEIPVVESKSLPGRLWGTHGSRPGVIALGAILFCLISLTPAPDSLLAMLSHAKSGDPVRDAGILGHPSYMKMKSGETIAANYCAAAKMKHGDTERAAKSAKVMMGTLTVAALFWATGALPIGFTAFLVGLLMYLFGVFPPDLVAKAYAKDAVIFIMGVLAFAVGIAKTGLDRRIGLLLLGTSKSLTKFLFFFLPLLGVAAAFFSEHALVAFVAPILIVVYMSAVRTAGIAKDHALAVILVLGICFAANMGGPGSPAAGGRNAVMVGILAEYNMAPSFGEWVKHGLPFVPVMATVIALYFFIVLRRKVKVGEIDIARIVRRESEKIGKMSRQEWITAGVLAIVIVLWIISGEGEEGIGMGGPVLLGLVLLSIFRIMSWRDVNRISWDVVALYASACAMGAGLASTGAALWLAQSFIDAMPVYFTHGTGLCVATSTFTGVCTQFMSDGATVSAIGPLAVPMATMAGDISPVKVGLATAFASSFANCLIIGTPNNAIAYSLAKDYETGEQLVTLGDFLKHGLVITLLALLVLWFGVFYLYWGQIL
jgi:sodium-dependent dicarboxylate transporter 2/3/5